MPDAMEPMIFHPSLLYYVAISIWGPKNRIHGTRSLSGETGIAEDLLVLSLVRLVRLARSLAFKKWR